MNAVHRTPTADALTRAADANVRRLAVASLNK